MKLFELMNVIDSYVKLTVYKEDESNHRTTLFDSDRDGGDFPFDLMGYTVVDLAPSTRPETLLIKVV